VDERGATHASALDAPRSDPRALIRASGAFQPRKSGFAAARDR